MRTAITLLTICLCCAGSLTAAVVGSGSPPAIRPNEDGIRIVHQPAWVKDPTEGGKIRGTTATWPANASRTQIQEARAKATNALIESLKLAKNARFKEMGHYVDPRTRATTVWLVNR